MEKPEDPSCGTAAMVEPQAAAAATTASFDVDGPDAPPAPDPSAASTGARKRKAPAAARKPKLQDQPIQIPVCYGHKERHIFWDVRGDDLDDCTGGGIKRPHVIGELPPQPWLMSLADLKLWILNLVRLRPETQDLTVKGFFKQHTIDLFDEEGPDWYLEYIPWDCHFFGTDKYWRSFARKLKRKRNVVPKFMLYVESSELLPKKKYQPIQIPVYYEHREMLDHSLQTRMHMFPVVRGDDLDDCLGGAIKRPHVIGDLPPEPWLMSLVDLKLWIFKLFRFHPGTRDLAFKGFFKQHTIGMCDEQGPDWYLEHIPWNNHYFVTDNSWRSFARNLTRRRDVVSKFMLYVESSEINDGYPVLLPEKKYLPIQIPVCYGHREMLDQSLQRRMHMFFCLQGDDLDDCLGGAIKCPHVIGELPPQPWLMSSVDFKLWILKLFRLHPETQDLAIKGFVKQHTIDMCDEQGPDWYFEYIPWDYHYLETDKSWRSFTRKLKTKRNVVSKFMLYVESSEIKHCNILRKAVNDEYSVVLPEKGMQASPGSSSVQDLPLGSGRPGLEEPSQV